jgi:Cdc6-like AAA superfamily ATPase
MITFTNKKSFGALFKKYRLRSEIETLSHFGDLLAEEGVVYESSLFTRWQNGSRLPNDRRTLLSIISIFLKQGGLNHVQEANLLLEKAGYGYLTNKDLERLPLFNTERLFQVPRNIGHFTGRKKYILNIKRAFSRGKTILLHGQPGVGKTALAIAVAHHVQESFPDGVFVVSTQ